MKNRYFLTIVLSLIAFFSLPNKVEGLFDLFTVYGKRNTKIRDDILKVLNSNTKGKVWKQDGIAYPHDTSMQFNFIVEGSNPKDKSEDYQIFSYTELNFKSLKIKNIEDVWENIKELYSTSEGISKKLISKTDTEITYEIESFCFPFFYIIGKTTQVGQYNFKQYEFEVRPKVLFEEQTEDENIGKNTKSVPYKLVRRKYKTRQKILTDEEKAFWFEMFEKAKINF